MEEIDKYLENNTKILKDLSAETYNGEISMSSVVFSFDYKPIIKEVCFARLYNQMQEIKYKREFSSNYFMRLPYLYIDENNSPHKSFVDYPTFFNELKDLVCDTYKITVYDTIFKNIKFVTMVSNLEMSMSLNYCLTLVLYTIMRGVEGESINILKHLYSKIPLTGNLKDYLFQVSASNRGSHHNINDSLDSIANNNLYSKELKSKIFSNYIDTLKITFGKDGLIHNPEYQIYFNNIFDEKPKGYGNAMQTKAFDYINKTTNKILMESLQ